VDLYAIYEHERVVSFYQNSDIHMQGKLYSREIK